MKKEKWIVALAAGAGVAALAYKFLSKDIPEGAEPVIPFDGKRYMGLWYEIARLPNFIEKNLTELTEYYSMDGEGDMEVITKAYNRKSGKWTEVSGKMKFAGADDVGMLKVSYLGPLYLAYNVLDIDTNYEYALVSGSGLGYLWILSRQTTIPEEIKTQFLEKAKAIGFPTDKLEWV